MNVSGNNNEISISQNTEVVVEQTKKDKKASKLTNIVPSSIDSTLSSTEHHFKLQNESLNDGLIEELNQLLKSQNNQIEEDFKRLEDSKNQPRLDRLISEGQEWLVWIPSFVDTYKEGVQEGIEFLENVLPYQTLNKFLKSFNVYFNFHSGLNHYFLIALDSGLKGFALIYRAKILEKSKEALKACQNSLNDEKASASLTPQAKEEMKRLLLDWEVNVRLEEQKLNEENQVYKISATSRVLTFLNLSLTHFPTRFVRFPIEAAKSGISFIMSGLDVVLSGFELRLSMNDSNTFNRWKSAYKKWHAEHLPLFKLSDDAMKRENQKSTDVPKIRSDKDHERALIRFLEQTEDYLQIESLLIELNMNDTPCHSKSEWFSKLYSKSTYRKKLIRAYINQQRTLESLNFIIQTSQNLLIKRQAIVKKKILLLKPRYHEIESKILDVKKTIFVQDMKLIVEKLQNYHCSPAEIKALLNKWCLNESPVSESILHSFNQFEKAKLQNLPHVKLMQNFRNEFKQWMENPINLDDQFKVWHQTQTSENLLEFYIDHQETIENTTKNALIEMVHHKQELEDQFFQLKLTKSTLQFTLATIVLTLSLTLILLGLLSIPFGGAGIILLFIALGPLVLNLGLLGVSYHQAIQIKPYATQALSITYQAKLAYTRIQATLQDYSHLAKEKKLLELAKILNQLHSHSVNPNNDEYEVAFLDYKKAKAEFEQSLEKVLHWKERLAHLEKYLSDMKWKDYALKASLQINPNPKAFDTLQAFQEAFESCDFSLLSAETKELIELHLGIDLHHLQSEIRKNPSKIKDLLKELMILEDSELIDSIRKVRLKTLLAQKE